MPRTKNLINDGKIMIPGRGQPLNDTNNSDLKPHVNKKF
jgi:hypothetical protein